MAFGFGVHLPHREWLYLSIMDRSIGAVSRRSDSRATAAKGMDQTRLIPGALNLGGARGEIRPAYPRAANCSGHR